MRPGTGKEELESGLWKRISVRRDLAEYMR